jgi:universal stress protein E
MRAIRRILVAVDLHRDHHVLTAGSCVAVDQAAELVKRIGCEVVLLHAAASDEAAAQARHALEQQADRFRSLGIGAEAALIAGKPAWQAIVRHVLLARIDLVIAGRRNERTHAGRLGLGSVSHKLLHDCPCAVWVAKLGCPVAPRCVLAASDLTPLGERVLEYAAFVASHCGAALHVVHAMPPLPDDILVDSERDARTLRLAGQLARIEGAPTPEFHVGYGEAADAVLEYSARVGADLVVMGTVSRGGLSRVLVGNTAERLLGHLDTSLLTVKPDDFVCPIALDD